MKIQIYGDIHNNFNNYTFLGEIFLQPITRYRINLYKSSYRKITTQLSQTVMNEYLYHFEFKWTARWRTTTNYTIYVLQDVLNNIKINEKGSIKMLGIGHQTRSGMANSVCANFGVNNLQRVILSYPKPLLYRTFKN